jgi:hypothetical protein
MNLAGYTWLVTLVEPDDKDWFDPTAHTHHALSQFQGDQPETFGSVDYYHKVVTLCGSMTYGRLEDTLLHEMGHIISWATGDANNETTANYYMRLLRDLQTPVACDTISRLLCHLRDTSVSDVCDVQEGPELNHVANKDAQPGSHMR